LVRGTFSRRGGAWRAGGGVRSAAVALFCGVIMLVAHDGAAQIPARAFSHPVKPKGFAEECFRLPAGASVGYAFESTAPVDFNIHFHRGSDIQYPVKVEGVRQADARFVAATAEDYCLMWTNPSAERIAITGTLSP